MDEKPPSPVLNNSKSSRRLIYNRKLKRKSSRVKLTDRFQNSISDVSGSPQSNSSTINETISVLNEENTLNSCKQSIDKENEKQGFQTATGRPILLSEDRIKQFNNLFEDILDSKENSNVGRSNKHSFLSKVGVTAINDVPTNVLREKSSIEKNFVDITNQNNAVNMEVLESEITENIVIKSPKKRKFDEVEHNSIIEEETHRHNDEGVNYLLKIIESNDDMPKHFGIGFKCASGKTVKLSETAVAVAKTQFAEIINDNSPNLDNKYCNPVSIAKKVKVDSGGGDLCGFKKASGKNIDISESAVGRAKRKLLEIDLTVQSNKLDFNNIKLTSENRESQIEDAQQFFSNLDTEMDDQLSNLTIPVEASSDIVNQRTDSFQGFEKSDIIFAEENAKKCNDIIKKLEKTIERSTLPSKQSKTNLNNLPVNGRNQWNLSNHVLNKAKNVFADLFSETDFDCLTKSKPFSTPKMNKTPIKNDLHPKPIILSCDNKKRLGIRPNRQIPITKDVKSIFDNISPPKMNSTPIKTHAVNCSTPQKPGPTILFNSTITPIKNIDLSNNISVIPPYLTIQECTKGNLETWRSVYDEQIVHLQKKLEVMTVRSAALKLQMSLLENRDPIHKKIRQGVLYSRKAISQRLRLKDLKVNSEILDKFSGITPQNAAMLHFHEEEATLKTEDGGIIIPNVENLIGLSEIEASFKVMPGVEPKLIHNKWIKNHYKWIVWKLIGYELYFRDGNGCLKLENIMQQLKYRYDREIDRAERPALRKILEKDDAPQKRMVLCVANIITVSESNFELELTDGWYSVRTIIDEPLSQQILKNKIKIGTKLIIAGAELLNCDDGCHPLDATDLVRLKINFNSTRRALWHCKLGFCRNSQPFIVSLNSIIASGGPIECIRVYVARIYPLKYLEKQGKMRVWRNKKADERRAQEWENGKLKQIEEVQEIVRRDYEKSIKVPNHSFGSNMNQKELRMINCPKTLYEMYESCKDPETFQETLSASQRNLIIDYQRKLFLMRQEEINVRVKENLSKSEFYNRDVTSVLKMIVLDATSNSDKGFIFQIWKADENHLHMLKEGAIFSIFNVISKINGDLNSTNKTKFKIETSDISRFNKYQRILMPISQLHTNWNKCLFNEFDTAGIIVQLSISTFDQSIWLSDANQSLVYIKIFEGPKNCLLLENLNIGDIITASNLIISESKLGFAQAIANHSTVISKYPSTKHLQEGINLINNNIINKDDFIKECQEKISFYLDKADITKSSRNSLKVPISAFESNLIDSAEVFNETVEENTLIYSRTTSIDVAMSMIDIDQFV